MCPLERLAGWGGVPAGSGGCRVVSETRGGLTRLPDLGSCRRDCEPRPVGATHRLPWDALSHALGAGWSKRSPHLRSPAPWPLPPLSSPPGRPGGVRAKRSASVAYTHKAVAAAVVRTQHVEGDARVGVEVHPALRLLGGDELKGRAGTPLLRDICQLLEVHGGAARASSGAHGSRVCLHRPLRLRPAPTPPPALKGTRAPPGPASPGPPRLVTSRTLANPRSPTRRGPEPSDLRMWAGRPSLQVAVGWGGAGSGPLAWSQFGRLSLESAVNARGAPRITDCMILARASCRGAATTRGNSFAFFRNQNSVLQGTLDVFSRLISKEAYS